MRFFSIQYPWAPHTEQLYLTTFLWRKGHLGNEAAHNQGWHCEHGQHKWVSNFSRHKWLFEEHVVFYNIWFVHSIALTAYVGAWQQTQIEPELTVATHALDFIDLLGFTQVAFSS